MSIIEGPVREGGASEQRRALVQGSECLKHKGIRNRGGLDVAGQCEVEGINDHGVRKNGSVSIVPSCVKMVPPRESIGRSHMGSRSDLPDKIEVLKKEGPARLPSGEFAWVFEIG